MHANTPRFHCVLTGTFVKRLAYLRLTFPVWRALAVTQFCVNEQVNRICTCTSRITTKVFSCVRSVFPARTSLYVSSSDANIASWEDNVCLHHRCSFFPFCSNEQYGFVNHALELLVLRNYGPEVWEDIKWVALVHFCVYCLLTLIGSDVSVGAVSPAWRCAAILPVTLSVASVSPAGGRVRLIFNDLSPQHFIHLHSLPRLVTCCLLITASFVCDVQKNQKQNKKVLGFSNKFFF